LRIPRFDQGGTNVRAIHHCVLSVMSAAVFCGLISSQARADAIYSVSDLGQASPSGAFLNSQTSIDPTGNYLGALSASQQAAFQAGSFDVYAHPATASETSTLTPDYTLLQGTVPPRDVALVTSNNNGEFAGTALVESQSGSGRGDLVRYMPASHVVPSDGNPAGIQSSGYLGNVNTPLGPNISFLGAVAGLNDHAVIAYNVYEPAPASPTITGATWAPYISTPGTGVRLGTLGGTVAFANALNNSNQVVGSSQIANGALHAFLYFNGSMRDLNLLIPPMSGVTLTSAVGIDAAGEIVAYGTNVRGQTHEYLLTPAESPVPEPSSLAVMSLAIAAVAIRQVRRNRKS
jgi:probable HAF family extracellular repeat protein